MIKYSSSQKCQKHNQDIILVANNIQKLCIKCITDFTANLENDNKTIQEMILVPKNISNILKKESEELYTQNIEILMNLKMKLANWQQSLQQAIKQNTNKIDNEILQIKEKIKGMTRFLFEMEENVQFYSSWDNIKLKLFNYSNLSNDIVQSAYKIFQKEQENYENIINSAGLYNSYDFVETLDKLNQFVIHNDEGKQNKQIYEQLFDKSICQEDLCRSLIFNQDSSILISGHISNKIRIYDFKNEKITLNQELCEHTNIVQCLYFMKDCNQFVSGSFDKTIRIWSQDQFTTQWHCSKILRAHISVVQCLIMNLNEDLIISGSRDNTIKFWSKSKEWNCIQTLTNHDAWVSSLSLNSSQNLLISCQSWGNKVLVFQFDNNQQCWFLKQTIITSFGYSLSFINDEQFVYQPKGFPGLDIYKMDTTNNIFKKVEELKLNSICQDYDNFQMKFNNSYLIHKNGQYLNITKIENDEFLLEQEIKYETEYIIGVVTNDGRYIVTYDNKSKEIQIRKYIQ
ncbi:unnamed protein product [Paramecium sonneborni]|uniref:Uncharacterized protein n=1 Tax=Paramecium sonneborni TaxID=65129 RepID=A0A8S1PIE1_9CILI|nr:unnamed protein product [Paramecium sonneborni]